MKRLLSILLMCALLSGCRAKQKIVSQTASSTTERTETDVVIRHDNMTEERFQSDIFSRITENVSVDIVEITYDTDKPNDPATGEYPVKSIKKTNINGAKDETRDERSASEKNGTENSVITDNSTTDRNSDSTTLETIDVAKDPYRTRYIFYILIVVVGMAAAIFMYFKKINPLTCIKWVIKLFSKK